MTAEREPPWSERHGQFLAFAGRVVEAAPNAMIVVDHRGKIVFANAQTEQIFGYERAELFDQSIELLVPTDVRRSHRGVRARYTSTPEIRPMGHDRRVRGIRKDGVEVVLEIGLSPIVVGGETLILSSVRDIADQIALEKELEELRSEVARLRR